MKSGLRIEQELSDKQIKEVVKKAEFQKCYDKLLRFVNLRPRSENEINGWFKKHKVHKSLHKDLFNRLKRLELLDDKKFAMWWVEQRLQFKFKSKRELENELRLKGINNYIIEDVLSEVDIDDVKIARALLIKKKYRWEKLSKLEARRKISDFLARKGFSWEVIKNVIDDVIEND
jgi:regulatory protein